MQDTHFTHLQLHQLAVGYNGRALISGIEIGVRRGEIITLVGPNGSGKSTILKSITRQLTPVGGEILLDAGGAGIPQGTSQIQSQFEGDAAAAASTGETLKKTGHSEKSELRKKQESPENPKSLKKLDRFTPVELAERMAVVLTGRLQAELMTCRDITAMGRYPYTGRLGILSEEDEQKVDEALDAVHARHLVDRPFDAVSDGERQRILLARAICQDPEIIVLDEPTSYLDIRHKLELLSILYRMSREQGITVVMSLHEIDLAMKISDRVICVRGDRIFACGKPAEVLDNETVRRLYDLDPSLGHFDVETGSLELDFARGEDMKAGDLPANPPGRISRNSRIMLAAPSSGSGKTMITCGLLRLLQRGGLRPAAFKCGPDYIDPMFHRQVLGIPSRNLDTFFSPGDDQRTADPADIRSSSEDTVLNATPDIMARAMRLHDADMAVIEGVMGYFDGTGASGMEASSWDLACRTQTPVVLVVNARGMSRSIVPLLKGFAGYPASVGPADRCDKQGTRAQGADSGFPSEGSCRRRPAAESAGRTDNDRSRIRGVILNRISAGMFPMMKAWIETDTDLRVIGYLPQLDDISWESRHLGLLQPEEIEDLQAQVDRLADVMEKTIDKEVLLDLARSAPPLPVASIISAEGSEGDAEAAKQSARAQADAGANPGQTGKEDPRAGAGMTWKKGPVQSPSPRIAVARDEAFNFYYEDNLELLRECGADLVFFSPIHDKTLPEAEGLLLGGGYPELHAPALARNASMKESIRARAAQGMPILAECGGFMYLQEKLLLKGLPDNLKNAESLPMCGILPGTCRMTDRLVRFGYIELENRETCETTEKDGNTGYLADGHHIRGHEFHYFDSTENGDTCTARRPGRRRSWDCMVVQGNIMAGFPHLYYRSDPDFAAAFVGRCRKYGAEKYESRSLRSVTVGDDE